MGWVSVRMVGGWLEGDSDADNKAKETKTKMSFIIHVSPCTSTILPVKTH